MPFSVTVNVSQASLYGRTIFPHSICFFSSTGHCLIIVCTNQKMKDSNFSQMMHIYVIYPAFIIGFICFKPANSFITLTLHNLYPFSKLLCFASVDSFRGKKLSQSLRRGGVHRPPKSLVNTPSGCGYCGLVYIVFEDKKRKT